MRCNACDAEFSAHEVIWRKDTRSFEDLCRTCRRIVQEALADFPPSNGSRGHNERIPQQKVYYYEDSLEELDHGSD